MWEAGEDATGLCNQQGVSRNPCSGREMAWLARLNGAERGQERKRERKVPVIT